MWTSLTEICRPTKIFLHREILAQANTTTKGNFTKWQWKPSIQRSKCLSTQIPQGVGKFLKIWKTKHQDLGLTNFARSSIWTNTLKAWMKTELTYRRRMATWTWWSSKWVSPKILLKRSKVCSWWTKALSPRGMNNLRQAPELTKLTTHPLSTSNKLESF